MAEIEPKPSARELEIRGNKILVYSQAGELIPSCSVLQPAGTFSHGALEDLVGSQVKKRWTKDNTSVVNSAILGESDLALAAVENAVAGFVNETTYRILLPDNNLQILGEIIIPIDQTLFGTPDSFANGIVRSHPKAFEQCTKWLKDHPNLTIEPADSTADAVRLAAISGDLAIGPKVCGEIYDYPVLEYAIQDSKGNKTKFWLLGYGETQPTDNDRTTLFFELKDVPGAQDALTHRIAQSGLNQRTISLIHGDIDQYKYLLHIDEHAKNPVLAQLLEEFKHLDIFAADEKGNKNYRVLGSYQKSPIPQTN